MPVKTLSKDKPKSKSAEPPKGKANRPPSGDTISKNGKRVPANEKGKEAKKHKPERIVTQTHEPAPPPPPSAPPPIAKAKPFKLPKNFAPFPGTVCGTLADICVKRENAATEEHNACAYIKDLDEWMTRHGDPGNEIPDDATEQQRKEHAERLSIFQMKCTEYQRAERARDGARTTQRWLAKKYDAVIRLAIEPDLHDDATNEKLKELMKDGPDLPLFSIPPDKTAVKPGSTHRQTESGALEEEGDDEYDYVNLPIAHLATIRMGENGQGDFLVSNEAVEAMKEYGWKLIRDINNLDIPGLTVSDVRSIESALTVLQEQEKDAKAEASAGA